MCPATILTTGQMEEWILEADSQTESASLADHRASTEYETLL